jgi:iron complex transport system substrate-binding protein
MCRYKPFVVALLLGTAAAAAAVEMVDDRGTRVRLDRPAARVISYAPHITELLFAIGLGDRVVGVVERSDFPEAAKKLPLAGSNELADPERILALKPDLILAWLHGSAFGQLERLRATGVPVFFSDPQTLDQIARDAERYGELLGAAQPARAWARQFRQRHARLLSTYAQKQKVTVFYQFWSRPMYTLNRRNFVSDLLATCGATNVFGDVNIVAPEVNVEAVLAENPQMIIGAVPLGELRAQWKEWKGLEAARLGNLYSVDPDLTHRAGPRAMDAAEILCRSIDEARQRIAAARPADRRGR